MPEPTDAQLRNAIADVSRNRSLALVLKHFHGFDGIALTDAQLANHIDVAAKADRSLHRVLSHYARHTDLTDDQLIQDINVTAGDEPSLHLALRNITTFSAPVTRNLYGRLNVAIPSGVTLPEAIGGELPHTYALTGFPDSFGVTFTAGTRTLSGTPAESGDHDLTYTATDAAGETVQSTFTYSVLHSDLATDAIALSDFDDGKFGYHVSTLDPVYAVTLISGLNAGNSDVDLFRREPRGTRGSTVDDPLTTYNLNPGGTVMTRIRWRGNRTPARILLYHDNEDDNRNAAPLVFSDWWADNPDRQLYLQNALTGPGVTLDAPDSTGQSFASWNDLLGIQGNWIRDNMDNNDRFIMVIAD